MKPQWEVEGSIFPVSYGAGLPEVKDDLKKMLTNILFLCSGLELVSTPTRTGINYQSNSRGILPYENAPEFGKSYWWSRNDKIL